MGDWLKSLFRRERMGDKYLVVGLGNPGREYSGNRHNAGFQVLDRLYARYGITSQRKKPDAFVADATISGRSVLLVRPTTYMNLSGRPVGALARFYQVPLDRILVVVDDLDLPVGTVRLRPSGGAAGQKGMLDIIRHLGSQEFARLRVGIGRPPGRMDPAAYVLQDFGKDEMPLMLEAYDRAVDAIEVWLRDGIELAMSRFNGPAAG